MISRPRISLSITAALAIVAGAYLVRSLAIRGGDFSPDLPSDAIVAGALAVSLAIVWLVRRSPVAYPGDEHSRQKREDKDDPAGHHR